MSVPPAASASPASSPTASTSALRIPAPLCNTDGLVLHSVRRPDAGEALRLARRRFLAPARIDMSALADELGVNRVTLYRWFGSRDRFLVELIWSLAERTLDDVRARVTARGPERIVAIVTGFLDAVIGNEGMQRWLGEEGEHAMRLLTRHETGFQPRLIAAIEALLEEESLDLPVDTHELAYVLVRVIESYAYLDLITGERPSAQRAEPIVRMLVGGPTRPPS
jgi:AcrR family transcriptional regulator